MSSTSPARRGWPTGIAPIEGGVAFHMSCHSRAQNIGQKGAEMLRSHPAGRCRGRSSAARAMAAPGATRRGNFETALKVGKPVARQRNGRARSYIVSECPLAGTHIAQGIERLGGDEAKPELRRPSDRADGAGLWRRSDDRFLPARGHRGLSEPGAAVDDSPRARARDAPPALPAVEGCNDRARTGAIDMAPSTTSPSPIFFPGRNTRETAPSTAAASPRSSATAASRSGPS